MLFLQHLQAENKLLVILWGELYVSFVILLSVYKMHHARLGVHKIHPYLRKVTFVATVVVSRVLHLYAKDDQHYFLLFSPITRIVDLKKGLDKPIE